MPRNSSQNTDSVNRTSWLQQWLENIWYNEGKGRLLLLPLSALYCFINGLQRRLQTNNVKQLACPVIVVGNITVGGTGKTPLTIHIVELVKKAGYKPAIITRGYGGKARTWPQAVTANSDPTLVGDEAVLMASRTQVPVYAGANRLDSIEQLTNSHECDVVIADDGLQHYKLPRDIQIAVIDGVRQLGNGYCLPAGPLREPKERLGDCDFVVVNGGEANSDVNGFKRSSSMALQGNILINLKNTEQQALSGFSGKTVHALTGIGNPQRFYDALEKQGLELIQHRFPDHHDFNKDDLLFDDTHAVIMTEKDAVKCHRLIGESTKYWMLPVIAELDETFDQQLLERLKTLQGRL